jgi:hypothetical protein
MSKDTEWLEDLVDKYVATYDLEQLGFRQSGRLSLINLILDKIKEAIGEDEAWVDPFGMPLGQGKVEYRKVCRNELRQEIKQKLGIE